MTDLGILLRLKGVYIFLFPQWSDIYFINKQSSPKPRRAIPIAGG